MKYISYFLRFQGLSNTFLLFSFHEPGRQKCTASWTSLFCPLRRFCSKGKCYAKRLRKTKTIPWTFLSGGRSLARNQEHSSHNCITAICSSCDTILVTQGKLVSPTTLLSFPFCWWAQANIWQGRSPQELYLIARNLSCVYSALFSSSCASHRMFYGILT